MNKAQLLAVILAELQVIFEEGGIGAGPVAADTVLFGDNSLIDSLALVGLIIKVEEYILEQTGREVQLIDEDAIINGSQTPFRHADALADLALLKSNAA